MATILTKKKDTSGAPSAGDLTNSTGGAELAVNTADKRLYTKDSGGNVVEVGTNPSTINIDAGSIDGTPIGANSASTGSFTTLNTSGAVVFNDAGADVDFRVEGDTNANLLFVDASTDRVGIGTSTPSNNFVVSNGGAEGIELVVNQPDGANTVRYFNYNRSASTYADVAYLAATHQWRIGNTERMRIDSSGNLLVGTTSANGKFNLNVGVSDGVTSTLQTFSDNVNASHFQIKRADAVVGGFWEGRLQITSSESGGYSGTIIEMRGKDGSVWMPAVYNDSVTGRDMYISSSGQLGYLSSVRASKTNIEDLPSVDWLYQLNPVKFQYRTKDEEGNYTETAEAEIQYGLIAEDVEAVNADLVFYNETEAGQELAGVQYSRLIAPLLQAVKDLKAELDTVKAELATLKG